MTTANETFKGYSAKSKAKRALVQTYNIAEEAAEGLLVQHEGKWGFNVDALSVKTEKEIEKTETQTETEVASTDVQAVETVAMTSASPFGALLGVRPPAAAAPTKRSSLDEECEDDDLDNRAHRSSKGLKIEKDRPEQNGVTMPSVGGICREIWDHLSAAYKSENSRLLTLKEVRSELSALDETTVSVQYYRWRKYNGIVGRQAKKVD